MAPAKRNKIPGRPVIDLGKEEDLCGFRCYPDQTLRGPGIITSYRFYVSNDSKVRELVDEDEFSNIKNDPIWQIKKFASVKARYIKLSALKNTEDNDNIGYAELDVITN